MTARGAVGRATGRWLTASYSRRCGGILWPLEWFACASAFRKRSWESWMRKSKQATELDAPSTIACRLSRLVDWQSRLLFILLLPLNERLVHDRWVDIGILQATGRHALLFQFLLVQFNGLMPTADCFLQRRRCRHLFKKYNHMSQSRRSLSISYTIHLSCYKYHTDRRKKAEQFNDGFI